MADFHIVIGYRTVSTWSLRGWLALRKTGVAYDETLARYRTREGKAALVALSPTGKVPYLIHRRPEGEVGVWDSLAIAEYLAELFPAAGLWPADPVARAFARSMSAEMHSGFRPLREHLSMDLFGRTPKTLTDAGALADVARVQAVWNEARERWGKRGGGPYLFGRYSIADAMFAPVVTRFRTYATPLDPVSQAYCDAMLADPDFLAWEAAAHTEGPADPQVA